MCLCAYVRDVGVCEGSARSVGCACGVRVCACVLVCVFVCRCEVCGCVCVCWGVSMCDVRASVRGCVCTGVRMYVCASTRMFACILAYVCGRVYLYMGSSVCSCACRISK